MPQPVAAGHRFCDETKRSGGHVDPGGLAENGRGVGQACDHQAVPIGQHLVVPARPDALVAHRLEPGAQDSETMLVLVVQQHRCAVATQEL